MDRPVSLYTSSTLPWRKPIIETQWTDSLEIYQKWYSAVNEKAMASPLPIYHQWCIADKPRGSNKLLLRGWPHWWKWKLPHGHPSIHSPLFSIQQSELVSIQGTSYLHDYFLGVGVCVCVCVCTDRKEQTHNLSLHMGWKICLYSTSVLEGEDQRFSHCTANVHLDYVQTARFHSIGKEINILQMNIDFCFAMFRVQWPVLEYLPLVSLVLLYIYNIFLHLDVVKSRKEKSLFWQNLCHECAILLYWNRKTLSNKYA